MNTKERKEMTAIISAMTENCHGSEFSNLRLADKEAKCANCACNIGDTCALNILASIVGI